MGQDIAKISSVSGISDIQIGDELTSVGNTDGEYRVRVETESFSSPLGESVFVTVLDGSWEGHRIVERLADLSR